MTFAPHPPLTTQSQWRCFIFSIEGLDPDAQDFAERAAALLPTTRKSFVHLTKDDLSAWVRRAVRG